MTTVKEEQIEEIKKSVMEQIDVSRTIEDEEVMEIVQRVLEPYSRIHRYSLREREELARVVFHALRRLDILQKLIEDDEITEIMVNGTKHIFYEKDGQIYEWGEHFTSEEKLQDVIQQIVGNSNRMVNELHPIVDTRLSNGSRVNVVLKPVAVDGSTLSIRRFPKRPVDMGQLLAWKSLSEELAVFLQQLVYAGYNIFISGGTGSGKTTFLNALSGFIPKNQRIVTIEDSAELQINGIPNLVRLESRDTKLAGAQAITIRDLIKSALRMRPDRIIVGECRGAEALDVLQAMNTGHDGSISTGHANSAADMISRIETMVRMGMELPIPVIRGQIASGIDIIIHLGRLRNGTRKVLQIAEVMGIKNEQVRLNELYCYQETEGEDGTVKSVWRKKDALSAQEKMRAAGL